GEKSEEEQKQDIANAIKGLYDTMFAAIDESRNNYFSEQFSLLDAEKKRIEENAEAEKKALESSLLSKEEKAKREREIENEKLASEKALDNKRRQLQREQAQREKNDAIFKALMQACIATAKSIYSACNPILAVVYAALIAAQTVSNISMISSRLIPEYWKGVDDHPG